MTFYIYAGVWCSARLSLASSFHLPLPTYNIVHSLLQPWHYCYREEEITVVYKMQHTAYRRKPGRIKVQRIFLQDVTCNLKIVHETRTQVFIWCGAAAWFLFHSFFIISFTFAFNFFPVMKSTGNPGKEGLCTCEDIRTDYVSWRTPTHSTK